MTRRSAPILARRLAENAGFCDPWGAALGLLGLPGRWLSGAVAVSSRRRGSPPTAHVCFRGALSQVIFVLLGHLAWLGGDARDREPDEAWPVSMFALAVAMSA